MAELSSSVHASRKRPVDAVDGQGHAPSPPAAGAAQDLSSTATDAAEAALGYDKDQHILDALRQWSTSKRSGLDREQLMAKLNLGEGFRQSWRSDVQQDQAVNGSSGSLGAWFDALPTTLPSGGNGLRSIRAELEAILALSQASRNAGAAAPVPEPLLKRARTGLEESAATRLPSTGSPLATVLLATESIPQNAQPDAVSTSARSNSLLAFSSSSRDGVAIDPSSSKTDSTDERSLPKPPSPPHAHAAGMQAPLYPIEAALSASLPTPSGLVPAPDPTIFSHTAPAQNADGPNGAGPSFAAATSPRPITASSTRTLGDYVNPWPLNPALAGTFAHFYRGPLDANQVTEILKQDISKSARRALTGQHTGYLGYFHFVGLDDGNPAGSRGPRPGPRRLSEQPLPTLEKWQCRVCHTELRVPPARVSNLGTHLYGLGARNLRKRGCFADNLATPAEAVPPPDRDDAGNIVPIGATSRRRRGGPKPEGQTDGQEEES